MFIWGKHYPGHRYLACQQARSRYTGKLFVSYERNVTFHIIFVKRRDLARRAVARGVLGGGGGLGLIVELTYSESRVGHSENYGNNSITKF